MFASARIGNHTPGIVPSRQGSCGGLRNGTILRKIGDELITRNPDGDKTMRGWQTCLLGGTMLAIGYVFGASGVLQPSAAMAQQAGGGLSADAENKIRAVNRALTEAVDQLRSEGKYTALTEEPNAFLVLCGGGDARLDLQEGNGIDPESFAALYAGRATPEVAAMLGKDDQGRITYEDKPIQMYSRSRLARFLAERTRIQSAF